MLRISTANIIFLAVFSLMSAEGVQGFSLTMGTFEDFGKAVDKEKSVIETMKIKDSIYYRISNLNIAGNTFILKTDEKTGAIQSAIFNYMNDGKMQQDIFGDEKSSGMQVSMGLISRSWEGVPTDKAI